jgi:hypothetical protein
MNAWPCVPVVSYWLAGWLADWLIECELAWCYEGDGDFFAFGGDGVLFRVPVSPLLLLLPPVLGFSLAVAARVVLRVCVASCPSPFSSSECVILTGRYSIRMAGCCWMRGIASIGGGRQGLCTGVCAANGSRSSVSRA